MLFKISKLAILLLSLIVSMIPIKSFAYNIEVANEDGIIIYYSWINDKTELAVSQGPYDFSKVESGKLIIPASVSYQGTEYPVTLIGAKAFYACCHLKSVVIPNSVTSIGDSAFDCCSFLMDVIIPNSVKSIGNCAFYFCDKLKSITIPNSVTSIGNLAFAYCFSLTSMTIPESVISIGSGTFFDDRGLESVKIYSKEIGQWFSWNPSIKEVVIGDNVQSIGDSAFVYCTQLNNITIPKSVINIGKSAFEYCNFTSISIPKNVITIGKCAFRGCSDVKKLVIEGNPNINEAAFEICLNIDSIVLKSPIPPKMINCIYDDNRSCRDFFPENIYYGAVLSIPKGSYDAYIASDTWSRFKLICTSGDNGYEADFENDSIYYTYKDDGVYVAARRAIGRNNYIGRNNFDGPLTPRDPNTGGLQPRAPIRDVPKKTISDSLDYIPYYGHIVIPESVTVNDTIYKVTGIDDLAFKGCEELESVIIPESVKQIGYAGFAECTNLTQITIPAGVELIDMYAFAYCSGLKRVIIQGNPMIDETAFIGCGADLEIITTVVESHQATEPNSVTDGAVHYGIDGRRIQADAPGLHIIKRKDGTVTKALVR